MVEGVNGYAVTLVLLNDVLGIIISVERVHEDEWDINAVGPVEIFNLTDGQIKERHALTDFDNRFGTNTTHRGSETTIKLENSKLGEELGVLGFGKGFIRDNLGGLGGLDTIPIPVKSIPA